MKKRNQILGILGLLVSSVIYDMTLPEKLPKQKETVSYVILEGAFLKQGKYTYDGEKTLGDIVEEVGVKKNANLAALDLNLVIVDESRFFLPVVKQDAVSLNHASKTELMTLHRVGEKTAQKIIDYRNEKPFTSIEDIMNVKGIGEKTYLTLRERLCL